MLNMKSLWFGVGSLLFVACASTQEPGVMTQEERLAAQLALAEKQDGNSGVVDGDILSDTEEAEKFDRAGAEHELKRASLSAADCPNTLLPEDKKAFQPGTAELKITFEPTEGEVSEVILQAPYNETPVGKCVLRAIEPVRVKPFAGESVSLDWTIELPAPREVEQPKKK